MSSARLSTCMLFPKYHNNTIQVYSVTVMTMLKHDPENLARGHRYVNK